MVYEKYNGDKVECWHNSMRGYSYKTKWAQEKFPGKVYLRVCSTCHLELRRVSLMQQKTFDITTGGESYTVK